MSYREDFSLSPSDPESAGGGVPFVPAASTNREKTVQVFSHRKGWRNSGGGGGGGDDGKKSKKKKINQIKKESLVVSRLHSLERPGEEQTDRAPQTPRTVGTEPVVSFSFSLSLSLLLHRPAATTTAATPPRRSTVAATAFHARGVDVAAAASRKHTHTVCNTTDRVFFVVSPHFLSTIIRRARPRSRRQIIFNY